MAHGCGQQSALHPLLQLSARGTKPLTDLGALSALDSARSCSQQPTCVKSACQSACCQAGAGAKQASERHKADTLHRVRVTFVVLCCEPVSSCCAKLRCQATATCLLARCSRALTACSSSKWLSPRQVAASGNDDFCWGIKDARTCLFDGCALFFKCFSKSWPERSLRAPALQSG